MRIQRLFLFALTLVLLTTMATAQTCSNTFGVLFGSGAPSASQCTATTHSLIYVRTDATGGEYYCQCTAGVATWVQGTLGSTQVTSSATVTPATLSFGSLNVGAGSVLPATVQNTGGAALNLTVSLNDTADFSETDNCSANPLNVGASCRIDVTCSPASAVTLSKTLTVSGNASNLPQTVTLSCTGVAAASSPTWSSAALTPTTPTITIPNTQQMAVNYTNSSSTIVGGTSTSYWSDTGGGTASSWTLVNGPGNQSTYKTAFNTTASKTLGAVSNTLNNLLVVEAMGYNAGGAQTFTISDTNVDTFTCTTLLQGFTNTRNTQFCYTIVNATASNTITCAVSTGYSQCTAQEWSGNKTTTPLDVNGGQAGSGTAAMTAPSVTTTSTNELFLGYCYDTTASGTDTAGSGFTLDWTGTSGLSSIGEHKITGAAGAYQVSATDAAAGQNWMCNSAAFLPGTAGTGFFSTITPGGLITAQAAGTSTIQAIGGTVAQTATGFVTSGTTATVALAVAQTPGNTNIVKVSWGAATGTLTSVTDTAGNTYTCQTPEQANSLSVALCDASPIVGFSSANGNVITVTMGQTTSNIDVVAEERNFTVASSIVDGSVVNATGASGAATASVSTTNATDVVVAGVGLAQTISTVNAPFTVDATSAGGDALISAPAFSASTLTPTANLSGGAWVMQALAFKVVGASTSATISAQAVTTVYYMAPSTASPPGNDSNACTQASLPCLSFTRIFALLNANCPGANGCQVLLENGIYNTATGTGFFKPNCGTGGNVPNGTASAAIIFQAQNERQAWLQGGGTQPISALNCSYWQVIGLHASNADNSTPSDNGYVAEFINWQHGTIQRNIFDHNNRFKNSHVLALEYGSCNNTVTENEVYYYHRWGILSFANQCAAGSRNVFLRNYENHRSYDNIAGGYNNGGNALGMGSYGSTNDIFANNICEQGAQACFSMQPNGGQTPSSNQFLGDIANGASIGWEAQPHDNTLASAPSSNSATNFLAHNPTVVGWWSRNSVSSSCTNCTVRLDVGVTVTAAFDADSESLGDSAAFSSTITDAQAFGNFSAVGFTGTNGTGTWSFLSSFPITISGATGSSTAAYNCSTVTCSSNTITNPSDSCMAWVSTASPMHNAGSGGNTDKGANILFEYDSTGTITTTALWSSAASCQKGATNCFVGTGAIVAGLNDVAGSSLYDIGTRLNINQNGCAFPGTYTPAP